MPRFTDNVGVLKEAFRRHPDTVRLLIQLAADNPENDSVMWGMRHAMVAWGSEVPSTFGDDLASAERRMRERSVVVRVYEELRTLHELTPRGVPA